MFLLCCLGVSLFLPASETEKTRSGSPEWNEPLSLGRALQLAFENNAAVLKGRKDIEIKSGQVWEIRSIALPQVQATGGYEQKDPGIIERFSSNQHGERVWNAGLRVTQSVYQGGALSSAKRAAKLTEEQSDLEFRTVVQDVSFEVKTAYYDALLAEELVTVQEASVALLEKELEDAKIRLQSGTGTNFHVLRSEVELANAKPKLIRAKTQRNISKQNLIHLLGFSAPEENSDSMSLNLSDKLQATPWDGSLTQALTTALENRTELKSLEKASHLSDEKLVNALSGYKPSAEVFAGYGTHNSTFSNDLSDTLSGWNAGVQFKWAVFDGMLTQGQVRESRALLEKSKVVLEDRRRAIDLEVRTAYASFVEAKEVLASQEKVIAQAEEALRLAHERFDVGSGTQLDVLSAQTALTEARSIQAQSLRDYNVALAKLERATGAFKNDFFS